MVSENMNLGFMLTLLLASRVFADQGCPQGWKSRPDLNSCYKAYSLRENGPITGLTWDEAEQFCRSFPLGHLASINSATEQEYIDYSVQDSFFPRGVYYWIGLRKLDRWTWSDGSPYNVLYFDLLEDHSTSFGQDNCVGFSSLTGKWVQQNCMLSRGWFCEIPKGLSQATLPETFPPPAEPYELCGSAGFGEGKWLYDEEFGECTFFSTVVHSWEGARQACIELDAQLVTISSSYHKNWIAQYSSQISGSTRSLFWTGLRLDIATDTFQWTDGSDAIYRAWETSAPDSYRRNHCVAQSTVSGLWKDWNCGTENNYICARTNRTTPPQVLAPDHSKGNCPLNWVEHQNQCYYFSVQNDQRLPWTGAKQFCSSQPYSFPDLVSIQNQLENDFILAHLERIGNITSQWIGLFHVDYSYQDFGQTEIYGWSDNSNVQFLNWNAIHPYATYPLEMLCVKMVASKSGGGEWFSEVCTAEHHFICKAEKSDEFPPLPPPFNPCPQGFKTFRDDCFMVQRLPFGRGSWDAGQSFCKQLGGPTAKLARINDIYENSFIHTLLADKWRGGYDGKSAWIGMTKTEERYLWRSDNFCPVVFSNIWDKLNTTSSDACVQIGRDGKWRENECNQSANFAVCEIRNAPCAATFTLNPNYRCPVNFSQECGRACYYVETGMAHNDLQDGLRHEDARERCSQRGGILARIMNEDDQHCLASYIESSSGYPAGTEDFPLQSSQIRPDGLWIDAYGFEYGGDTGYNGYICEAAKVRT